MKNKFNVPKEIKLPSNIGTKVISGVRYVFEVFSKWNSEKNRREMKGDI